MVMEAINSYGRFSRAESHIVSFVYIHGGVFWWWYFYEEEIEDEKRDGVQKTRREESHWTWDSNRENVKRCLCGWLVRNLTTVESRVYGMTERRPDCKFEI